MKLNSYTNIRRSVIVRTYIYIHIYILTFHYHDYCCSLTIIHLTFKSYTLQYLWIQIPCQRVYSDACCYAFTYRSYFCACAELITIATRAIDRTVWTVWQLAPPCSACASAYVSKPVLVQGSLLLHRSVLSSIPGYTEL